MNFTNRSYQKELLDKDNIPFGDIMATMQELSKVNAYLGGHRVTKKGISFFLDKISRNHLLTIAEIGCGGGDNLAAIHTFLTEKNQQHVLTGIDIKRECIDFAKQNAPGNITWICSDYRTVSWPGKSNESFENRPDIIFSSLFCHHFTDEQLLIQLRWLKDNSRIGFFINDLHRHKVAWYSIRILTRLFSRSYLVKNDGPLSVARAFKKEEWRRLLSAARIGDYTISWLWAFRYLICVNQQ